MYYYATQPKANSLKHFSVCHSLLKKLKVFEHVNTD